MTTATQHPVYLAARRAWCAGADFRARRARFKSYTYGRQWDDPVTTPDGSVMTEGAYASASGKQPLTNNLIRQLVKSVVGRFRHSLLTSETEKERLRLPGLDELDARMLEEFLISGCAVQRVGLRGGSPWVENVSPARFFVNAFSDPRGSDIELVGMLHDLSLGEVILRYAHSDAARSRRLRDIYRHAAAFPEPLAPSPSADFDTAAPGRCRVIEVWALESHDILKCHDTDSATAFCIDAAGASTLAAVNEQRSAAGLPSIISHPATSLSWHAYFFAPGGVLIDHTESPFSHASHPFAVKCYPLTDGEIHPFVEDIIDQQRYINRLITLIDHVMSFSAKGVLLFPVDQKPDNISWEQLAAQWCRPNSIIPYNSAAGQEPRQMYSSGALTGASELLNIEMKMFEQISGVSGALQGQSVSPATGVEIYRSQIENSTIALLDIFETFNAFRTQRNTLGKSL